MSLPERVATLALSTFEKLPQRCKPRIQADGRREWTPMSAIILACGESDNINLKCVSLGTGTKCLPASQISKCDGLILHDCHAEILAFRGLNRWLLNEIRLVLDKSDYISDVVERTDFRPGGTDTKTHIMPFQLRSDVLIYMFSTTAPCGDASMGLLMAASTDQTPWSTESLASDLSAGQPLGRGHFSLLGAMRRKPARGDAEATMSKSCTDKMALKQFTGLLGFPADMLLRPNQSTFLKALIVYDDQYDNIGYGRAFGRTGRFEAVPDIEMSFFDVHILPKEFPRFGFERGGDGCKATNISAVYVAGSNSTAAIQEVLVNGVKQGYRQFEERSRKGSVLCRRKILELAQDVCTSLATCELDLTGFNTASYSALKQFHSRRQRSAIKEHIVKKLGGWMSISREDDFSL